LHRAGRLGRGPRGDEAAFAARGTVAPVGRNPSRRRRSPASFRAPANREETDVIGIIEGKIITEHLRETIPIVDGDKRPDTARDLLRIAVIERHGKNGNIATGFVRGFGMKAGAIAATVSHDHHNIACVGVDYADMALAAERLGEIEGGFVVARDGKVLAELALPVAGLMSLAVSRRCITSSRNCAAPRPRWAWCCASRSCSLPSWRFR
jgi:adenine deaminase